MDKESKYSSKNKYEKYESKVSTSNTKFNEYVSSLQKTGLIKNNFNLSFKDYKKTLYNEKNLQIFGHILSLITNKDLMNDVAECFVTVFLIVNFKDKMLIYKTSYEEYLYKKALNLHKKFEELLKDVQLNITTTLVYKIDEYLQCYAIWIESQQFNTFNSYLKLYKDYERCSIYMQALEKTTMNDFIQKFIKTMMSETIRIAGENFKEFKSYLDEFTVPNIRGKINNNILKDSVEEFYIILEECIKKKRYNMLKGTLTDISKIICRKLNRGLRTEIERMFNIDELFVRLNNDKFTNDDFIQWSKNIFNIISIPLNNKGIVNSYDDFKKKINNNLTHNFILFVKYFYIIFEKIDKGDRC